MKTTARRALAILLVVAAFAGLLVSCSDDGGPQVTIYSGRTEDLIDPLLDRFEEETGIDVEVRYGDSADLALLISEEGDKTPADVFLSQSPGAVGFLDQEGRLAPLPGDVLSLVDQRVRAGDGHWVGLSGRQRVLNYNTDEVDAATLPSTVLDLIQPAWRGRLGIAPSNGSFQDFVTAMRLERGDDRTREWLRGIAANDPQTYPNNNAVVAAVDRGEIDAGLVNHYYNHRFLAEDPGHKGANHTFAPDDVGSLLIVTAVSLVEGSGHRDEATQLIRFLLEEQAQTYFAEETFEYPLAGGVGPAPGVPPLELTQVEGVDFDRLGGDLASTREMIREAGLEG